MRLRRFALKERRNKGTTDLLGVWLLVEGGFIWPETVPHTTMPYFLLLGMSSRVPLILKKISDHFPNWAKVVPWAKGQLGQIWANLVKK